MSSTRGRLARSARTASTRRGLHTPRGAQARPIRRWAEGGGLRARLDADGGRPNAVAAAQRQRRYCPTASSTADANASRAGRDLLPGGDSVSVVPLKISEGPANKISQTARVSTKNTWRRRAHPHARRRSPDRLKPELAPRRRRRMIKGGDLAPPSRRAPSAERRH